MNKTGLCKCGCGQKTTVPKWNNFTIGRLRGVPLTYIHGHNARRHVHSLQQRQRMSKSMKGKGLGRKITEETRRKLRECHKGAKSYLWKGGITPINKSIRNKSEYKLWRIAVFTRDDYTCQLCKKRGVSLQADHIKPFALYPELRFAIDNGRTLCITCHMKTDSYLFNFNRTYATN